MRNRENQDHFEQQVIIDNQTRYQYFVNMLNKAVDHFGVEKVYNSNIESVVRLCSDIGFDAATTAANIVGTVGQICYRKARSAVLYSDVNRPISTELRNKYMATKTSCRSFRCGESI